MSDLPNRIEIDPKVMVGKPAIRGTRITVELILKKLALGPSWDEILKSHPRLQRDDIAAALGFAAKSLGAHGDVPARSTSS